MRTAAAKTDFDLTDGLALGTYRTAESPYSVRPLLPEIRAPDPFIIQKSRQLNKRVTLNVGGVRHDVLWKMLEQVGYLVWHVHGTCIRTYPVSIRSS